LAAARAWIAASMALSSGEVATISLPQLAKFTPRARQ